MNPPVWPITSEDILKINSSIIWRQLDDIPNKGFCLPNLLKAMKQEGCFLCNAVIADSEYTLNSLFYEGITDEDIQKELIESGGLCNWHAWRATYFLSASGGLKILYQSLLENLQVTIAHWIRASEEARGPRLFSPRRIAKTDTGCPICKWNHNLEKCYLSDFLDLFKDDIVASEFEKSFGLCLPHLQVAADDFPQHINLSCLLKIEQKKFEVLREQLVQSDHKQDNQSFSGSKGADPTSWRQAIELFVGKRGIFPRSAQ